MYRTLCVKVLLLLCFVPFAGAETKQVVTEMQIADNDTIFKFSYIYNNFAQPVVETKMKNLGSSWENISQTEWYYDENSTTQQVYRIWANNQWNDNYHIRFNKINSKTTETHSSISNNLETDTRKIETDFLNNLKIIETEYLKLNSNWEKKIETRYFYSLGNLVDSILISHFENNTLTESYKTSYIYNPTGTCKFALMEFKSAPEMQFKNTSKSIYSYKNNTTLVTVHRNQLWNNATAKWENDTKLEYYYNNLGTLVEEIAWNWKLIFWGQIIRYNYEFDAENQIFKKLVSIPLYRDWRNTNSVNYLREPKSRNMTIESVYGFWGGKTGDKLNTHISFPFNDETIIRKAQSIQLKYIPFFESSIPNTNQNASIFKVYPNPSNGIFYISNFDSVASKWTLTSLNGAVLKSSSVYNTTAIVDISDLPNGIYLLNMRSASENSTHKIVKY